MPASIVAVPHKISGVASPILTAPDFLSELFFLELSFLESSFLESSFLESSFAHVTSTSSFRFPVTVTVTLFQRSRKDLHFHHLHEVPSVLSELLRKHLHPD